jgi:hypothetical protein
VGSGIDRREYGICGVANRRWTAQPAGGLTVQRRFSGGSQRAAENDGGEWESVEAIVEEMIELMLIVDS